MSSVPIAPPEPVVDLICDGSMEIVIPNESGRKRQLADRDGFVKPHKPVKLNKSSQLMLRLGRVTVLTTPENIHLNLGPERKLSLLLSPKPGEFNL